MRRALALPLTFALLLAACARSEEASMVPPDGNQGYNRVDTVRSPEQDDREPAIGQWRAALQDERQALEFGPMGTEPLFSLLCMPEGGGVVLQRHGAVPAGALPTMQVTIGAVAERLPVTAGGGTIPMLRAELRPTSRLFGQLTAARQAIVTRLDDGSPLIMPASPLVADYLRSCGRPQGTLPGNTSAGNSSGAVPAGNSAAPAAPPAANAAQPRR